MNSATFKEQLLQLTDQDLQALLDGASLVMVQDQSIIAVEETEIETNTHPVIISYEPDSARTQTAEELRNELLQQADELLENYYRLNPLSQSGFDLQVKALALQHGVEAFSAVAGQTAEFTLFVEGNKVIAEPRNAPRHPYGAFLELQRPLQGPALEKRFSSWLRSAEAYQRYLSMNTCRYSC